MTTRRLTSATIALALLGCGDTMHALTGDTMGEFAVHHMTPYLMGTSDLDMGCETGVSLVSMLLAYGRVTDAPHQAAIASLVSAGRVSPTTRAEALLTCRSRSSVSPSTVPRSTTLLVTPPHSLQAAVSFAHGFELLDGIRMRAELTCPESGGPRWP